MNPLFSERQRRRMNPVIDVAPENEERSTALNAGLAQTWPVKAVEGVVNPVLGMIEHTGETLAGRADAGDVTKPFDFVSAMSGASPATAARGAAGVFGGRLATGWDREKENIARSLDSQGKSREFIWQKTGFMKDADGHWKHEIDDSTAKLDPNILNDLDLGVQRKLSDVYKGPALDNYPHLGDLRINNDVPEGATGVFRGNSIGLAKGRSLFDVENTLAHELDHAIAKKEGFAQGSSPEQFTASPEQLHVVRKDMEGLKDARGALLMDDLEQRKEWLRKKGHEPGTDPWEYATGLVRLDVPQIDNSIKRLEESLKRSEDPERSYFNTLGEINARNTAHRRTMNVLDRKYQYPWETADKVMPEDLIILGAKDPDPLKGWFSRRGGLGGLGGR